MGTECGVCDVVGIFTSVFAAISVAYVLAPFRRIKRVQSAADNPRVPAWLFDEVLGWATVAIYTTCGKRVIALGPLRDPI
jgi:hypothetical protein